MYKDGKKILYKVLITNLHMLLRFFRTRFIPIISRSLTILRALQLANISLLIIH